jgi:hypothetical protein
VSGVIGGGGGVGRFFVRDSLYIYDIKKLHTLRLFVQYVCICHGFSIDSVKYAKSVQYYGKLKYIVFFLYFCLVY